MAGVAGRHEPEPRRGGGEAGEADHDQAHVPAVIEELCCDVVCVGVYWEMGWTDVSHGRRDMTPTTRALTLMKSLS